MGKARRGKSVHNRWRRVLKLAHGLWKGLGEAKSFSHGGTVLLLLFEHGFDVRRRVLWVC
jgi:hypothetical protein